MIKLRPYQDDCIARARVALRSHKSVLLQAPTGAGKTAMASFMLTRVADKGMRGFFICHRRELIEQTAKTFDKIGLAYGYIAAGMPTDLYQQIQICSIDTLKNRLDKVPVPDFCIWDEAHHLGAAGWRKVRDFYSGSYHVGLSATPSRLDGKGLDDQFDFLVPGPQVQWLIDQGFLAKYKMYSVPGVDLSEVHSLAGEYVQAETERLMQESRIVGDIVRHWKMHGRNMLTIGFAVSIKHSLHMVEKFNEAGIPSAHLDGKTPKEERKEILMELAKGELRVVWNVGLFGEGFDIAANSGMDVTVGCVIDAAPTKSLSKWLQRCGRALRPQDEAVILDHSENAMRHDLPCKERTWTLKGREKRKKGDPREEDDELNIRQCEECYCVFSKELTHCPACGKEVPVKERRLNEEDGVLEQLTPEKMELRRALKKQGRARDKDDLVAIGKAKGIARPDEWAEHVLAARQEKDALRKRLINLSIACEMNGVDRRLSSYQISPMKPKELRLKIQRLEDKLVESNAFG